MTYDPGTFDPHDPFQNRLELARQLASAIINTRARRGEPDYDERVLLILLEALCGDYLRLRGDWHRACLSCASRESSSRTPHSPDADAGAASRSDSPPAPATA